MKKIANVTLLTGLLLLVLIGGSAFGATTVVSDNYGVTTTTTGFALDNGVNFGINPPTTRITGSAKANLRYLQTATTRTASLYGINNSRLRVQQENSIGRFTLSASGSTPFDFSPALGVLYATPANPATYDIKISMRNDATTAARLSFGLATAEGDVTTLDFGIQLYRAVNGQDFYTVQKRIDAASGTGSDINTVMMTMPAGSGGSMTNFLIRVTDAGAESGANYNSRVQVSVDNGSTWVYDTSTNLTELPNGFRFDGAGRYIIFDQAANVSGNVFYDSFSISSTYAPAPPAGLVWTGGSTEDHYWSSADNWGGNSLASGSPLVFNGTARQVNTNDLADLAALSITFSNGGFGLYGNTFTNTFATTNLAGVNTLGCDMEWGVSGPKNWTILSGSELVLSNTNTVEVSGDHYLYGGGTLRQRGDFNIGQRGGVVSPAFSVMEGLHVIDGGSFVSRGSYRVGSMAAAPAGAQTLLTNNATLYVTATGGSTRVGDSANAATSRLVMNNSTYKSDGTPLYIPYVAGATGEVVQVGGLVACPINFCYPGTNSGTYIITNGTLDTRCITNLGNDGNARMYFENAVLRAGGGAYSAFFSGLDRAEIYAGGLTLDAQIDIVVAQKLVGVGGLTNIGPATVTLSGANTYTGPTVISAGKLILQTGRTYKGPIQLADSAGNPVTLEVQLRSVGSSLNTGALNLGKGDGGIATLNFDLGAFSNPTAPLIVVTNLSINSVVSVNLANGFHLSPGRIVLIDYEGSFSGSFDALTLANLPGGITAELVNNTANSSIDLNITAAPGLLWTGANGPDWDTTTVNWKDLFTGLPTTYSDNMMVDFRDGANTGLVSMVWAASCAAITVSNDTLPYVWSGDPNLGRVITPILQKNGPGSLTRIGGDYDLITTLELNAGSYIFSNANEATFTSLLTDTSAGTGTFVKRGEGKLTVTTANDTFNGSTVIQEGMVVLGDTRSLGATTATVTITNGGTLELNDHQPVQPVIVCGDGVGGQGAIIDSTIGTAVEYNLRDVVMTGDTTFGCASGRWDLRANSGHGPGPGLRGNGFKLTKMGAGHVSIANQRTTTGYWHMNLGDVLVKEGQLTFAEAITPDNPSAALAVYPNAIFNVYDLGLTNPLLRNITITNAMIDSGGASGDTNLLNGTILLSGDCRIRANQCHLIINGAISGAGSINFWANDPGTLLLNGINTYTGDTTVTNGTIGGTGSLAGNLVMLGGTNAPGADGVGTFTVNGDVTLANVTRMELNRSLSPNSDRLVVGGSITAGGTLLVVLGAGASAPQANDVYQLFNKGVSGFAVVLPTLGQNLVWEDKLAVNGTLTVKSTVTAPPDIGAVGIVGGDFTFSGTGGTEGSTYYIVSSPDAAAPLAGWTPVASNVFGPGGTFSFTTNMLSAPKTFFRVQVP